MTCYNTENDWWKKNTGHSFAKCLRGVVKNRSWLTSCFFKRYHFMLNCWHFLPRLVFYPLLLILAIFTRSKSTSSSEMNFFKCVKKKTICLFEKKGHSLEICSLKVLLFWEQFSRIYCSDERVQFLSLWILKQDLKLLFRRDSFISVPCAKSYTIYKKFVCMYIFKKKKNTVQKPYSKFEKSKKKISFFGFIRNVE